MKIVFMYVDYRPKKVKVKSYAVTSLKVAAVVSLLMLNPDPAAVSSLGSIVEVIPALPMPIVP